MRQFFILLCSLFLIIQLNAQGISFFEGTWQEAVEEAKVQGKLVFVDAYTTWCGPCKRMAKTVFTQDKVGDFYNEYFINVKVDMEKTNGREFGSNYPVSAYPTLIFLDGEGKLVKKSVGGKPVDAFVALGKDVLSKHDFSLDYKEKYENGDVSYDNVLGYIAALNKSNKSSLKVANDFLLANPQLTQAEKVNFIYTATSEVDSKIYEMFLENKKDIIKKFGVEAYQEKVVFAANRTWKKGLEFQDENLQKEALKAVKKEAKPRYAVFSTEANLAKAIQIKDVKEYMKASKKWLAIHDNVDKKMDWMRKTQSYFPKNDEVNLFVYQSIKKDLANVTDKNHVTNYVKFLAKMGKMEEAVSYLQNVTKNTTDPKDKKHFENLINYLQKV